MSTHEPHDPAAGADLERDAWLSQALRHAPDADAAPSPVIRETILRQARAAAASTPVPPRLSWSARLLDAWRWLGTPRIAGALASVVLATVVGLMWRDRPIDEALQRAEPDVTAAVVPPAASSTPPLPPSSTTAETALKAEAPAPTAIEATPPAPRAADTLGDLRSAKRADAAQQAQRSEPQRAREAAEARAQAKESERLTASESARDKPRADAAAQQQAQATDRLARGAIAAAPPAREPAAANDAAVAPRSVAPAAPAPAPAPPTAAAPAPVPAPAPAPTPSTESAAPQRRSPLAAAAPAGESVRQRADAASATSAFGKAAARDEADAGAAAPAGWSALLNAVEQSPQRWRWQRDDGAERETSDALLAWLRRLDRAAAGRWTTGEASPGSVLRLLRDGDTVLVVTLGDDGRVRVDVAGSPPAVARLAPATAAALRRALDDALR